MQFLHPQNPTRVSLIKAALRQDKEQVRWVRLTFSLPINSRTAWLPKCVTKSALSEVCAGGDAKRIELAAEVEDVTMLLSQLPEQKPSQAFPCVTITAIRLQRCEDGATMRFSADVRFGDDVARWLAKSFGADVYLRCEDAQPELPMDKAAARASRHGGRAASDYACPDCGAPENQQCRRDDGYATKAHAARRALAKGDTKITRRVAAMPAPTAEGAHA